MADKKKVEKPKKQQYKKGGADKGLKGGRDLNKEIQHAPPKVSK